MIVFKLRTGNAAHEPGPEKFATGACVLEPASVQSVPMLCLFGTTSEKPFKNNGLQGA